MMHNLGAADRLAIKVVAFASGKAVEQFQRKYKERQTMEPNPKLNIRGLRLPALCHRQTAARDRNFCTA